MDRAHLVEQSQPFGEVHNMRVMPGAPCDYGFESKSLGPTEVRMNNGYVHGPSLADQAPNAQAVAAAHLSDPFWCTGRPGK